MSIAALVTWILTALGGLFLLAIWLIEYDPEFQRAAATRLPIPVISGHVLCALSGLGAWILYLITDKDSYAWATVVLLGAVAALGFTMAFRWFGVYRSTPSPRQSGSSPPPPAFAGPARDAWTPLASWPAAGGAGFPGAAGGAGAAGSAGQSGAAVDGLRSIDVTVPPERHFPLGVVIAHGIFASITILLVVLTILGVAGS